LILGWAGLLSSVDSGSFKLHLRAPTGMRIEETANLCDQSSVDSRADSGRRNPDVIDNIGLPFSGINLSYSTRLRSDIDADILVTLSASTIPRMTTFISFRLTLPRQFPGVTFAFLPADMVSQILNFGLPARSMSQIVETTWRETSAMPMRCSAS